jgi:hypothetical protein
MRPVLYVDDEECLPERGKSFLEIDGCIQVETSTSARSKPDTWGSIVYDVMASDHTNDHYREWRIRKRCLF